MALRAVASALLSLCLLRAQSDLTSASAGTVGAADLTGTPPPLTCPAGAPIGAIDLRVRSPHSAEPLPFQSINHLSEGDTVIYTPIVRGMEKRPGEVALVMLPAKREANQDLLIVSEPKRAAREQEWKISQTVSLAAFVYGPQGLNRKTVKGFLSQDDQLVAQLADYAEKTSQTEALLAALSDNGSSAASMNAALSGFASQYGLAVQIDKNAPPAVQAQTLFATMNPQLATYNPLASSTAQRFGQTASVATAAATLFFGSPIGLAAGGTAMLLDLRSIAFPNTQFRSSFAQNLKTGVALCGQRAPAPPHTRVAFIWASRIPNTPTPAIHVGEADFIPQTQKTPVPVEVPDTEWKYLQRARKWTLQSDKGQQTPVTVLKLGNQRALEIDLSQADLPADDYRLAGFWDWTPFQAQGQIHVRPLSDFKDSKLLPASQNRLLAHAGKIPVTLTGADFEFTSKIELKKEGDEFATPEPVRFILPKGLRTGPQSSVDVQIDTAPLDPGKYALLISQQDGKRHPVPVNILPAPPKIGNLPILVNQGVAAQHFVLKGERLELLARLNSPDTNIELGPPAEGGTERNLTVRLQANLKPGTVAPVEASFTDRSALETLPGALQVTGPLPIIASSKLSLPAGIDIALRAEEFPAGYTFSALLDVKNIEAASILRLACAADPGVRPALHIGEQGATSSLQQLSQDQLFVSYDTSTFPAGCALQATIDNGRAGMSQPFTLAHIVRLPQIESFQALGDASPAGLRGFSLTGNNLEMIEKVAWDEKSGVTVTDLPTPIPGHGQQQSLSIKLPDPPGQPATLFIWLRGDAAARVTTIQFPSPTMKTGALNAHAPVAGTAGALPPNPPVRVH